MRQHAVTEVEVEIDFRATIVRVRRKGVPHATIGQFSVAHYQLAALDAVLVDVLADATLIRRGLRAKRNGVRVTLLRDGRGVCRVCRTTQKEKLGGIARFLAGKCDLLRAHANVDAAERFDGE